MTSKEKAIELVKKIYWNIFDGGQYDAADDAWYRSKQCALIAVDELINSHLLLNTTHENEPSIRCKTYWQEVKQEIEKL